MGAGKTESNAHLLLAASDDSYCSPTDRHSVRDDGDAFNVRQGRRPGQIVRFEINAHTKYYPIEFSNDFTFYCFIVIIVNEFRLSKFVPKVEQSKLTASYKVPFENEIEVSVVTKNTQRGIRQRIITFTVESFTTFENY